MASEPFIVIPTWDNGKWTHTTFDTVENLREFILPLFKEPGQYNFNETSKIFNEEARRFRQQNNAYCLAAFRSKDFIKYWNDQKEKCRRGVIYIDGDNTWYLPREYYMWINFLPIYDKIAKKFDFPKVWDVQYHIALYEYLAEIHYKHGSVFKKRQIASSYYHSAKIINLMWFEEGAVCKMGASESRYIDSDGTWAFLEEYKDFLNGNTAWYRPMNPSRVKNWQQQIEVTQGNRTKTIGNKSRLIGLSFEQSPTKGVGGPCSLFFYEEGGIAPTADKTLEYIRPAMSMGQYTTGIFIIAGSVGELKDAGPLKEFTLNPEANDIYSVETNLLDEKGTIGKTGLFIPEQWGMPPHIDKDGNSQVSEALKALDKEREEWKKTLRPDLYQLRVSQKPRNIAEGFAYREESKFPLHLVSGQKRSIEEKDHPYELVDLREDENGTIKVKKTNKIPMSYPVDPKQEDKSGSIVIWERPDEKPDWGIYYASIDPVAEGKTTTSESLCSIYVYKTQVEVTRVTEEGTETFLEGDKIVAAWCGRFDDLNKTHEKLRLIIEWYNAWTIVENNISLFIQYMIGERKQRFLVPKNQMVFLKSLQANKTVYQEFGWRNTGRLFKDHLLNYLIEWLLEVIDEEHDDEGNITKKIYGISRIPDMAAMLEMEQYREGVNVDRLVSLSALVAFAKIQQSNLGYKKRVENETGKSLQKSQNLYKLSSSPFRNLGKGKGSNKVKKNRSPYKRLR
jgi:hypothetical protein